MPLPATYLLQYRNEYRKIIYGHDWYVTNRKRAQKKKNRGLCTPRATGYFARGWGVGADRKYWFTTQHTERKSNERTHPRRHKTLEGGFM